MSAVYIDAGARTPSETAARFLRSKKTTRPATQGLSGTLLRSVMFTSSGTNTEGMWQDCQQQVWEWVGRLGKIESSQGEEPRPQPHKG
jgi:hypothetical protein